MGVRNNKLTEVNLHFSTCVSEFPVLLENHVPVHALLLSGFVTNTIWCKLTVSSLRMTRQEVLNLPTAAVSIKVIHLSMIIVAVNLLTLHKPNLQSIRKIVKKHTKKNPSKNTLHVLLNYGMHVVMLTVPLQLSSLPVTEDGWHSIWGDWHWKSAQFGGGSGSGIDRAEKWTWGEWDIAWHLKTSQVSS